MTVPDVPAGQTAPVLPAGFRLRPDPGLSLLRGGRVLLGGSPYRLIRLADKAVPKVAGWLSGEPVQEGGSWALLARRLLNAGMAHPVPSAGPLPLSVAVVIPVRDRIGPLARCLAGLADGPHVIVVDDGSARPEAVEEVARSAGARYVRRASNGGPAAARNTGLGVAGTDLVAFVDSDCVPQSGWLDALLPHFADAAVSAVAPRIVAYDSGGRSRRGLLDAYEREHSALDMGDQAASVRPGSAVSYVPSAALVVRRDAVGSGFDESMRVGEDVDLIWRLAAAGHHIRYEPAATVAHQHRTGARQWLAQRVQYGTSSAPLAARHPGQLPVLSMAGWSAVVWGLVLTRHAGLASVVTVGMTAALARKLAAWSDEPWRLAARLAGGGTVRAGGQVGRSLTRAWWPVALSAAVVVPRLRLPFTAVALLAPLQEYRRSRPSMRLLPWTAVRLADDLAYSVGVWQGCLAQRVAEPLLPKLWWASADGITPPQRPRRMTAPRWVAGLLGRGRQAGG
ncbi:mycofactocin biosynthesis glycosyltransferase MftF [Streptomyces sp. NPDC054919]